MVANSANKSTRKIKHGDSQTQKVLTTTRSHSTMQFTIANERFCEDIDFDILIYIFSGVKNIDQRMAIRASWGNSTLLKAKVKVVYIVGRSLEKDTQRVVAQESKDIVQGDFVDNYYGLANKSITAINWIHKYCKTAKVLMKTDDDLAVDMKRIIKLTYRYLTRPRHIMCYVWIKSCAIRNKRSKFYVSLNEFPGKVYPKFCGGRVYMYTADIVDCVNLWKLQNYLNLKMYGQLV